MDKIKSFFKKIHYNSPVVITFALLSFVALGLSYITKGDNGISGANLYLFSVYRSSPGDILTYFRVFLHVLGHSGLEHYLGNFMLILLVGPMLEEKYGSKNMIFMIAFTAVVTGAVHMLISSDTALLGASGIVFMMMLLSSYANVQKGRIPLTLLICVVLYIGKELYSGLAVQDNISNLSHIIGGICGAGFGYLINRKSNQQKKQLV